MSRNEKIEALAEEYVLNNDGEVETNQGDYHSWRQMENCFKEGLLAGIKLRNEELLAMEFDEKKVIEYLDDINSCDPIDDFDLDAETFIRACRWQFEQFMKAIKGG